MAHLSVTIAGRTYRMACGDGEEDHLASLADMIDGRISEMRQAFGEIGDQRLIVMAALTVADELSEAKRKAAELEAELAARRLAESSAEMMNAGWARTVADALDSAAARIEEVTHLINGSGKE